MARMTALEAKNGFGQFLDAVQRAPVTVTKNGREVGAMFSTADLQAMAEVYLWPPLQEAVQRAELTLGEALVKQVALNKRLEAAEADAAEGRVHDADDAFFEGLRAHVRSIPAQS